MWVLEVIKTSERVLSETRCSSINEIGTSEVLKDLYEGAFHSKCGVWIDGKVTGVKSMSLSESCRAFLNCACIHDPGVGSGTDRGKGCWFGAGGESRGSE